MDKIERYKKLVRNLRLSAEKVKCSRCGNQLTRKENLGQLHIDKTERICDNCVKDISQYMKEDGI